jgi:hypothetical protein
VLPKHLKHVQVDFDLNAEKQKGFFGNLIQTFYLASLQDFALGDIGEVFYPAGVIG